MEQQFTKGPYTPHLNVFCGQVTGYHITAPGGTHPLAEFHGGVDMRRKHATFASPEEVKANAHLFAAAPDLYEACAEFLRKVEAGEAKSTRSYQQMKAALAKADGETLPEAA